jgi:hypothetical protein
LVRILKQRNTMVGLAALDPPYEASILCSEGWRL